VSLVLESVLLSLGAGLMGVLGASLLQNVTIELSTVQTLSEITYGFHLNPRVALASLALCRADGQRGRPAPGAARCPDAHRERRAGRLSPALERRRPANLPCQPCRAG
jgi:hypothetical protein